MTNGAEPVRAVNNHNVFILGAGFSVEAGLPTMATFMKKMRDAHPWLQERGRQREVNAIDQVLAFRLKAAAAAYRCKLDLENIEDLFSLASAMRGQELEDAMALAIGGTLDYCRTSTEVKKVQAQGRRAQEADFLVPRSFQSGDLRPDRQADGWWIEAPFYSWASHVLTGSHAPEGKVPRTTFITFNYDSLLEDGLDHAGIEFKLVGPEENEGDVPDAGNRVQVLKLHGSVTWGALRGGQIERFASFSALMEADRVPLIVPPTWRKGTVPGLTRIWDAAVDAVSTATRLVFIGFSVPKTDSYFRYLLAAGLGSNISLRSLSVIDSSRLPVLERLKETLREEILTQCLTNAGGEAVPFVTRAGIELALELPRLPHEIRY